MYAVILAAAVDLARPPSGSELAALLWENAPDLQAARARISQARADLERAALFPNPELDLAAGTLPVGPQNPTAPVSQRWLEVPNVSVGLSERVELGKRGPRQAAAKAALDAIVYDARAQLLSRFFEVRTRLGELAATQARIADLEGLASDAGRLADLQRARAASGAASTLDADRALLEAEKLTSAVGAEREQLAAFLRGCAELTGARCSGFESAEAAERYLGAAEDAAPPPLEERPDVMALAAAEASQLAAKVLAERRAIPDPTFRFGYLRDQYLASGNWQNSLFAGLSVPLPVFERGQADARAAAAAADASRRARERTLSSAREQLERLAGQRKSLDERRARMRDHTLPLARQVVARLDAAVLRGATSIQDVLLARRALVELQLLATDLDLAGFRARVETQRLSGTRPFALEELVP